MGNNICSEQQMSRVYSHLTTKFWAQSLANTQMFVICNCVR